MQLDEQTNERLGTAFVSLQKVVSSCPDTTKIRPNVQGAYLEVLKDMNTCLVALTYLEQLVRKGKVVLT